MKYESLQYLDLYVQESGLQYQFFLDAFDVIQILQGVHRFYQQGNATNADQKYFHRASFEQESAVIHALVFGKFLGEGIRLLPTHQAELARLIKSGNSAGNFIFFERSDNTLKKFLERDLKFHDKLKQMTAPPVERYDEEVQRSWIEDKNKDIFKAIYLSYKANYKERLEELFTNGIIKIENYELDDIEIHDDYLFTSLSNVFKTHRPRKEAGGNNFSDVAALMYLARQVNAYNQDNSSPIPVYFDSHNYKSIIPRNILDTYFQIRTEGNSGPDAVPAHALRDHDFFKLYALANYNDMTQTEDETKFMSFSSYRRSADALQKSFTGPAGGQDVPGFTKFYDKGKEELKEKMQRYIEVDFYKAVIDEIKSNNLVIINNILRWLDQDQLNPDSAEAISKQTDLILKHIDNEINELMRNTVSMYNIIQNRIKHVMGVAEKLREDNQELDIFAHYSLFRFLIPKPSQDSLKYFFSSDGLLSGTGEQNNFSRISLWNFYYRTVYYKYNKGVLRHNLLSENELYILYGSFWILNLHDKVIDFNSKVEYLRPLDHSLLMLIGACVYRAIGESISEDDTHEVNDDDKVQRHAVIEKYKSLYENIIEVLEKRVKEAVDAERRSTLAQARIAQIKIVLAYLYFHKWMQDGNTLIVMRDVNMIDSTEYTPDSANYKAVDYARDAFEYFHQKDNKNSPHYLYAFNIFLYFVIDSAPDEEFRKINAYRKEFIDLKGQSRDWHFRFDDTIARNFHRLSIMVQSRESKLQYINSAISTLKSNLQKYKALDGRDIKEVRAYMDVLINVKGDLEIA